MSGIVAVGGSPSPSFTPKPQRRFFTRQQKRTRSNAEHVGRTSNVQTFFQASGPNESGPIWVEHAPPSLPVSKRIKREGAAVQVYKCRENEDLGHDSFYIYKVRIQSPFLRNALKDTLGRHGIVYDKHDVFAESFTPHRGLFFALDKIAELAQTSADEMTRSHCELLCTIIEDIFDDTLNKLEELEKEEKITYELLWTLFPEGSIFATQPDNSPPRAYRVKSIEQNPEWMKLKCEILVFDGFCYGTILVDDGVFAFDGAVAYADIPDMPYIDLSRRDDLRIRLLERGRRALTMQTIAYMKNSGNRETTSSWLEAQSHEKVIIDPYLYGERKGFHKIRPLPGYNLNNRDEIDDRREPEEEYPHRPRIENLKSDSYPSSKGYSNNIRQASRQYESRTRRQDAGYAHPGKALETRRRPTKSELELNRRVVLQSEDNLLIMRRCVNGYSIDRRVWDEFPVDNLTEIEADKAVFEKVVLDEKKKEVLKSLVEGHMESSARYDDLISGKGQCLLVILSGPPGTGKTLVAESLAEHLGCPLLRADPASIQPDMFQFVQGYDATIAQFLKDATEWGSLVLFDEPDFLFQNQESSTDRKDLLAFLRQVEYFKGIIFLTTNLGRALDPAVLSRTQIHITFPSLTEDLRVRVWQNFVDRLPEDVGSLTPSDIARLATWQVNGREIKNILNMAVSWYRKKGEFSVESIDSLITTICPSAKKEEYTDHVVCNGAEKAKPVEEELVLLDL